MPATPLPKDDSPPDPESELLANIDERIGDLAPDQSPADGGPRVRAEQIDLILRLHEIGAAWRERSGRQAGTGPVRLGRFEIVREVGQGGFATVYEALDTLLGRRVALKIAHPEALVSPQLRRRFVREAEIASRIVHPSLVTIHDLGESDGVVFIAAEFCDGGTLASWLDAHPGPVDPVTAARIVMTLADAVDTAHARRVSHRDIKPENVLLVHVTEGPILPVEPDNDAGSPRGGFSVKLGDFGLGKLDGDSSAPALSQLTRADARLGTPTWMAPEQVDGAIGAVGPATDVHALGLLLDRLLTGRCRWLGASDSETLRLKLVRDPDGLDRVVKGLPRDLAAVCLRCLARKPEERYSSGGELAADLGRFLLGVPTLARPITPWERFARGVAKRPGLSLAMSALLLALLVASLFAWGWHVQRTESARQRRQSLQMEAALEFQHGVEQIRSGNVSAAEEHFDSGAALDPELAASFAGRWCRRRTHGETAILATPTASDVAGSALLCVAVSPDGGRIATGAANGTLTLRSREGHRLALVEKAHDEINDVAIAPDGETVATVGEDGRVRLWNAHDGNPVADLAAEDSPLFAVGFSPDGSRLAWGGARQDLAVATKSTSGGWRVEHLAIAPKLPPVDADADIETLQFVDDYSVILACGTWVAHVALADGRVIREFLGHERLVTHVDVAPSRNRLVTGGSDRQPRLWDLGTGTLLARLPKHSGWIQGVVFTPDGQGIVTGCRDGVVRLFDADGKHLEKQFVGHRGQIWEVGDEPDGAALTVGIDGTLRRFALDQAVDMAGGRLWPVAMDGFGARPVVPGPTGSAGTESWPIFVASRTGDAMVLHPEGGKSGSVRHHADLAVSGVCLDPGRDRVALVGAPSVHVAAVLGSGVTASLDGVSGTRGCFTPAGQLIIGRGPTGALVGWDPPLESDVLLDDIGVEIDAITSNPEGTLLAYGGGDVLRLRAITPTGLPAPVGRPRSIAIPKAFGAVHAAAWSPDGRRLAIGSKRGNVRVVDPENGRTGLVLPGHAGMVLAIEWAADGRTILSADNETVRITDAVTGVSIDVLRPGGEIRSMNLADGPRGPSTRLVVAIATAAQAGQVLVTDVGE